MSEEEFMDVLTDIDEKYIEKAYIGQDALDEIENGKKSAVFPGKKMNTEASCIMIAILSVLLVIVTLWLLQRKTGNVDNGDEANEILFTKNEPTPTHYSIEQGPSVPQKNTPVCEIYQFMLWDGNEYIASIENSNRIGSELGFARVRNEEIEGNTTLFKDVVVYEFVGLDSSIAVIAYYPEDQEYYVYYNSTY